MVRHGRYVSVLLMLALGACQTTGVKKDDSLVAKLSCNVTDQGPRPAWVSTNHTLSGFYVGVGATQISQDHGADLALATRNAKADISATVQTSVSRIVSSNIRDSERSGLSQADHEIITRATTRLSLDNAKRVASWMDGQSCQLWVQVRVDEATVKRNLARQQSEQQLKQAEVLFDAAEQSELSLAERLHKMAMAINRLADVSFDLLPMQKREFYRGRYEARLQSLQQQEQSSEVLVLINAKNPHAKALKPDVASHLITLVNGRWHKQKQDCRAVSPCLNIARKARAKKLILVNLQTATRTGSMGSEFGDVNMTLAFYDVASGKALNQPKRAKGEVFSFDGDLDWGLAVQRAFDDEGFAGVW